MFYEGMTWFDLVRKYFPDADDKECEFILWETTEFPLVPPEKVEERLKENQLMWLAEKRSNKRISEE